MVYEKCLSVLNVHNDILVPCGCHFKLIEKPFFGSNYSFKSSWVHLYKLCTPGFRKFIPFFLADPLTLSRLWTAILRSLHRCSLGFKSWLWQGHSKTVRDLSRSCSSFVLFFRSMSCWRVNRLPSLSQCMLWSRFSSRTSLYLAAFILPQYFN